MNKLTSGLPLPPGEVGANAPGEGEAARFASTARSAAERPVMDGRAGGCKWN